jgi:hypothetical protein
METADTVETNNQQIPEIDLKPITIDGTLPLLPEAHLIGFPSVYKPRPLTKLSRKVFIEAGFEEVSDGDGSYIKFGQLADFDKHDLPPGFPSIRFLPGDKLGADVYLSSYAEGFHPVALESITHDLGTEHMEALIGFEGLLDLISLTARAALSDTPSALPARPGLHEDVQKGGVLNGEEKRKRVSSEIDVLTDMLGGTDFNESSPESREAAGYLQDFINLLKDNGLVESSSLISRCTELLGVSPQDVTGSQLLKSMFAAAREKCGLKPETGNNRATIKRLLGRLSLR